MVEGDGLEPPAKALSRPCSASELTFDLKMVGTGGVKPTSLPYKERALSLSYVPMKMVHPERIELP